MSNRELKKERKKLRKQRDDKTDVEQWEIKHLTAKYDQIDPAAIHSFSDFPLSSNTAEGLSIAGYKKPTEIQVEAISVALRGLDVLGAAQTGSGKTLAFIIPILELLYRNSWSSMDGVGALVITPTRELAYQIFEVFKKVGGQHFFSAALMIGGQNWHYEKDRVHKVTIIICTPGRLLHHMDTNPNFDITTLKMLVLDEADRILDMGFADTLNAILDNLPNDRQTLLFSATQTKSVSDLARLHLSDPVYISIHENAATCTPKNLQQSFIQVPLEGKLDVLWSFIKSYKKSKMLVFFATCKQVRFVYTAFCRLRPGLSVLALHGKMHQRKRMQVYDEFCKKQRAVLLATDIAARGLDFPLVHWVVQYDCPEDVETYIHRVGRTARYQGDGEALLMITPSEANMIDKLKDKKIPLERIRVNPVKQQRIMQLSALLARDVELKCMAQRAFNTYIKYVYMMKDKQVFNVKSIDMDKFSSSLGLALPPRVRFLEKQEKNRIKQSKNKDREEESGESETGGKTLINLQSLSDDEDSSLLTVKRGAHAHLSAAVEDVQINTSASSGRKGKPLTKAAIAKKIIKKNIKPNTKITFTEDGKEEEDVSSPGLLSSVLGREYSAASTTTLDIEQAKLMLRDEDKVDKVKFKERVQAKHAKEKAAKKALNAKPQDVDDFGSDSSGDDEEHNQFIDELPDPDKLYSNTPDSDDDDDDDSSSDGASEDDASISRRAVLSDDDDDMQTKSGKRKRSSNRALSVQAAKMNKKYKLGGGGQPALSVQDQEELALHLLTS